VGSHAAALRGQGVDQEVVDAIGTGDLGKVKLAAKDAALLKFVKLLTLTPAETKDADVQAMREVGWTDEQIWEATFEVGLFSMLNRVADAYGLDYPSSGWYPPGLREKLEEEKGVQEKSAPKEGSQPR
jgi:alkylhydroperoxidase family enzyme